MSNNSEGLIVSLFLAVIILVAAMGVMVVLTDANKYTEITGEYNGWEYETIARSDAKLFDINGERVLLNYTGDPDEVLTRGTTYVLYIDSNNYVCKWKEVSA